MQNYKKLILRIQGNEITEHILYKKLSTSYKGKNSEILKKISNEELKHYNWLKSITKCEIKPDRLKIFIYSIISKIFGLTFVLKMFERSEVIAQKIYNSLIKEYSIIEKIILDESKHEDLLINMIEEERLNYIGSMVLGLNDALVELTGALAGLTFALQNSKLIGLAGFITGFAASLSMAASDYLSKKSEKKVLNPLKSALYTGIAYIFTVILLIFPFFILRNYYFALCITLLNGILIVLIFTFFVSVVKEHSFKKLFFEMILISFGVSILSFIVGFFARKILGVEI